MWKSIPLLALLGAVAAQDPITQTLGYLAGTPGLNTTYDYVVVGAGTAVSTRIHEWVYQHEVLTMLNDRASPWLLACPRAASIPSP